MKALLAAFAALLVGPGAVFSQRALGSQDEVFEKAKGQQATERASSLEKQQIAQVAIEREQAIKEYPAWLVKTIASEFNAILDAANNFLSAPSQKNLELFNAVKKDQLQRVGVHICKFDEASQFIAEEERKRLGNQVTEMMGVFWKNEDVLEARIDRVIAEYQRRQDLIERNHAARDRVRERR